MNWLNGSGVAVDQIHGPLSYDSYIHRIGRTGRAGRKGKAFTFVDQAN